jgi:hypothetical protein
MSEKFFYTDDCPIDQPIQGGMFYRTMGLGKFIQECESKGYKILGIRLDETNNGELLWTK